MMRREKKERRREKMRNERMDHARKKGVEKLRFVRASERQNNIYTGIGTTFAVAPPTPTAPTAPTCLAHLAYPRSSPRSR